MALIKFKRDHVLTMISKNLMKMKHTKVGYDSINNKKPYHTNYNFNIVKTSFLITYNYLEQMC